MSQFEHRITMKQEDADVPLETNNVLRVGLRISLLLVTVVTVVVTALAIHLPWAWTSSKNTEDIALQLNREIIASLRTEITSVINTALQDQKVMSDLIGEGALDIKSANARESLLMSFLKSNNYYSFVGIGMPNGSYYGAQRRDASSISSISSTWDQAKKSANRTERLFAMDGGEYTYYKTTTKINDYYAPTRRWYTMSAEDVGAPVVTDTYSFSSTGRPGVNTALTVSKDKTLQAVVTIAIELDRLSEYMRTLRVGQTGSAFMMDDRGFIIASRESITFLADKEAKSDDLNLPRISEVQSPIMTTARQALESAGISDYKNIGAGTSIRFKQGETVYFVSAEPVGRNNWILLTVVPESDFSQRILANTQNVAFIVVGVTLLASLFALFISQRGFVKPLTEIIEQTHQLANFNLSDIRPVNSCITEIHNLAISVVQMGAGLGSFGKYLPAGLVKTLLANGVVAKPYAEKRTMSVLFMDLAGFTTISEALGPKIVPYLDRYFGAMTAEIEAVDGTIDKFIGDCVMAFWGAPFYDEEHPAKACAAALNCLETLEMLRGEWPAEWASKLDVRIGVNTGRVIVGNIGSHARINYTVVGDPVNLASRLESGCKGYGIRCMIGQSTYELAKYDIVARRLDVTHVKGKNEPVVVYELLAMADDVKDRSQYAWVDVYDEALSAFTAGDIAKARAGFLKTIELRGEDPPSSLFLERCQ